MRFFATCLIWVPLACLTACVTRTLTITSEPSGARVFVNDREVGCTPVVTAFAFYGVYDVRLEKDGFRPLWTKAAAPQPWWEYPGVDLLVELTGPKTVNIPWHFVMEARPPASDQDGAALVERAQKMRELNRLPAKDADEQGHAPGAGL